MTVVFSIEKLYFFWCEGCECCHYIDESRWTFNGDLDKPTVTPSLLVNKDQRGGQPRCHFFVTDGKLRYLSDCTHELAGQTVEMVEPP